MQSDRCWRRSRWVVAFCALTGCCLTPEGLRAEDSAPFYEAEILFPLEHWHNHASCIVEAPNGDLLVCWFHGSGERTADDVRIEGARKRKGASAWSERFAMADTLGFPDTNCAMFIDPQGRLWLLWPTILANRWESALMKCRISSHYDADGPPRWESNEILHVKPDFKTFEAGTLQWVGSVEKTLDSLALPEPEKSKFREEIATVRRLASDKLSQRLGWMTRAHPFVLNGQRLIVPLYSDGYSFRSWRSRTIGGKLGTPARRFSASATSSLALSNDRMARSIL